MNYYLCIQTAFCSISAAAVVGIVVAMILVLLGIIASVFGFLWKKRKIPMLPT